MLAFFGVAMLALFVLAGACGSGRGWFIDRRHIDSVIRALRRTRFADEAQLAIGKDHQRSDRKGS